jgi:hypothetical protein
MIWLLVIPRRILALLAMGDCIRDMFPDPDEPPLDSAAGLRSDPNEPTRDRGPHHRS